MAGTRGLAQLRGKQLNARIMRDRHFDVDNKINEQFIDIDFNAHREILEDTKIDVYSQVNNQVVAGLSQLDITAELGGKVVATATIEGVVIDRKVELRVSNSEDFPLIDIDGDRVYGRIEFTDSPDGGVTPAQYLLKFFSDDSGVETPYTFAAGTENVDFRYVLRTNMSVIPVDALVNGGAGFVEGATDANAYMNLTQLMKDIYGDTGRLDNDGNANLVKDIVTQIADEINARTVADTELLESFSSQLDGEGANLVGVEVDADGNYVGTTVQAVLTELAAKVKVNQTDLATRVTRLETKPTEEVYEAVGGETQYLLVKGKAEPSSVLLFINGQVQAPGINFTYKVDVNGAIEGFDFTPDTLAITEGVPDVLFIKYSKII